jgi:hypothetical protein
MQRPLRERPYRVKFFSFVRHNFIFHIAKNSSEPRQQARREITAQGSHKPLTVASGMASKISISGALRKSPTYMKTAVIVTISHSKAASQLARLNSGARSRKMAANSCFSQQDAGKKQAPEQPVKAKADQIACLRTQPSGQNNEDHSRAGQQEQGKGKRKILHCPCHPKCRSASSTPPPASRPRAIMEPVKTRSARGLSSIRRRNPILRRRVASSSPYSSVCPPCRNQRI